MQVKQEQRKPIWAVELSGMFELRAATPISIAVRSAKRRDRLNMMKVVLAFRIQKSASGGHSPEATRHPRATANSPRVPVAKRELQ
jgi:hypothetical protein